jgi:hypothetical protein
MLTWTTLNSIWVRPAEHTRGSAVRFWKTGLSLVSFYDWLDLSRELVIFNLA